MEEQRPRSPRHINLIGPTFLIGLGTIMLLNSIGYLDWSIWEIIRLWPLLLIAAGLQTILGRHSVLGAFFTAMLMLILFVGGVWLINTNPQAFTASEPMEISKTRDGAQSARVDISPAVAHLEIAALDDTSNFVEGMIQLSRKEKVHHSFSAGEHIRYTLGTRSQSRVRAANPDASRTWRLSFNPDVALDLDINLGVGKILLDLSDLTVDDVSADIGVGELEIQLPKSGEGDLHLNGGIGTLTIYVPYDVAVRIRADTAIVGRNMPGHYHRNDNVYTSPNYEDADKRLNVVVALGIGTVNVIQDKGD